MHAEIRLMANDDEKPDSGDDPWADLEAEGLPDLDGEFSFSFDEETDEVPVTEPAAASPAEPAPGDPLAGAAGGEDAPPVMEDAAAGDGLVFDAESGDEFAAAASPAATDPADADIDAWLADDDGAAKPAFAAEQVDASVDEPGAGSVHDDPWAHVADDPANGSSVDIGTGSSGIASASSIEAGGESGSEGDPFAGLGEPSGPDLGDDLEDEADAGEDTDPFASLTDGDDEEAAAGVPQDDADAFAFAGAAAAAADAGFPVAADDDQADQMDAEATDRPPSPKATASRRPRKKKSSPIGQLIGVVVGGALSIPIVFAILIWGFGRDPFQLTPLVPESLAFLLPAKFQPAGGAGPAAGTSLDAVLGDAGAAIAGDAESPAGTDLAGDDATESLPGVTGGEPEPVAPEPAVPEPTELAMLEGTESEENDRGDTEPADAFPDDPLMALIDEAEKVTPVVTPPQPEPEPEPEPLDLGMLKESVEAVSAAFAAAAEMPDDPGDPDDKVRRRLFAKCYLALAAYAEELAALEQVSAESGRPFGPALEEAASVRHGLAGQPDVLALLPRLSRDWFAYAKRSGDGVVTVGTLVESRRFGPSWRSQVSCLAPGDDAPHEVVVLSRGEPAVAPGEEVIIAGLAADQDVIWAADMGALEPAAAEPPEATDIFSIPEL
jgi:hypothetical protein